MWPNYNITRDSPELGVAIRHCREGEEEHPCRGWYKLTRPGIPAWPTLHGYGGKGRGENDSLAGKNVIFYLSVIFLISFFTAHQRIMERQAGETLLVKEVFHATLVLWNDIVTLLCQSSRHRWTQMRKGAGVGSTTLSTSIKLHVTLLGVKVTSAFWYRRRLWRSNR